jgi:hypothetical protein
VGLVVTLRTSQQTSDTTIAVNNFQIGYSHSNTFDISVGIVTRLRNRRSAFRFPAQKRNLPLFETSRSALGPTQPSIWRVRGFLICLEAVVALCFPLTAI